MTHVCPHSPSQLFSLDGRGLVFLDRNGSGRQLAEKAARESPQDAAGCANAKAGSKYCLFENLQVKFLN